MAAVPRVLPRGCGSATYLPPLLACRGSTAPPSRVDAGAAGNRVRRALSPGVEESSPCVEESSLHRAYIEPTSSLAVEA